MSLPVEYRESANVLPMNFLKEGAMVCVIDKQPGGYFTGDLADERTLSAFAEKVISEYGHVDYLINNALPLMKGIDTCSYDEFNYALRVGVTAPFYLAKLFAPYFSQGAAIINISSTRDRMSQPQTESYAAAKGGISALTHALAVSFSGNDARQLNFSRMDRYEFPGFDGADSAQHPAGRVGNPA